MKNFALELRTEIGNSFLHIGSIGFILFFVIFGDRAIKNIVNWAAISAHQVMSIF